jgi:hypothetical protein
MVKLGSRVKDSITGFQGIAIGRTEWLYGCARIGIQPEKMGKDNKPIEASWFDEQQIVVIKEMGPLVQPTSSAKVGGPQRDPGRTADARR